MATLLTLLRQLGLATILIGVAPAFGAANASPLADFHAALAAATDHYRQGQFYLRTGNAGVAALELEAMAAKWSALTERFAGNPPDTYAKDPEWRDTLAKIRQHASSGLSAANAGDTDMAKAQLKPIRGLVADLRRRNGVFLFADCVHEANQAFRKLYHYRHKPPDFDVADQIGELRKATMAAIHWYGQCKESAPPAALADAQFGRLMDDSLYNLGRISVAIEEKNQRNLINILRLLASWDRILYLKFG
jgi:hypothetical protein